jgi:transcriptional regulator with PAS, ATPase and Fis domain
MVRAQPAWIVAASREMREVLEETSRVAALEPFPVHIRGESGTGKELIARRLHEQSPRRKGAFVAVNSAALPDSLLEAELFGHTRGAFTGADRSRSGLVEEADGGTFFLDEVADLSPRAQTLLLRALQEREFRRVGESRSRHSDFRLVTATHKDLCAEVEAGRFRQDLYFRIDVLTLTIPPLRGRRDDILPLARSVLASNGGGAFTEAAEACLLAYGWPGNVRELQNEVVQALLRARGQSLIEVGNLSASLRTQGAPPFRTEARRFERQLLADTLARHGGNRTRSARSLGLSRQGLYRKMKRVGLI